ncbi:MAG: hypothetical protein QXU32_07300 [Nitrososphaerales archaeon]
MPFMCLTCSNRPVFNASKDAIDHMTNNPFHQMVYYDEKSIDNALDRVKKSIDGHI